MAAKDRMAVLTAMMGRRSSRSSTTPTSRSAGTSSRPAPMAAPSASSSPIAVISRRTSFLEVTRHFAASDPTVIMGVGIDRRCAHRRPLHRQRRELRRRADAQCRRRAPVQPPRHALQPRLRIRHGNRRRAGTRVRDRQGVPRLVASADPNSSPASWARCHGPASCRPVASIPTEASLRQVVRRRHRRLRHRQQPDHQRNAAGEGLRGHRGTKVRETIELVGGSRPNSP